MPFQPCVNFVMAASQPTDAAQDDFRFMVEQRKSDGSFMFWCVFSFSLFHSHIQYSYNIMNICTGYLSMKSSFRCLASTLTCFIPSFPSP